MQEFSEENCHFIVYWSQSILRIQIGFEPHWTTEILHQWCSMAKALKRRVHVACISKVLKTTQTISWIGVYHKIYQCWIKFPLLYFRACLMMHRMLQLASLWTIKYFFTRTEYFFKKSNLPTRKLFALYIAIFIMCMFKSKFPIFVRCFNENNFFVWTNTSSCCLLQLTHLHIPNNFHTFSRKHDILIDFNFVFYLITPRLISQFEQAMAHYWFC